MEILPGYRNGRLRMAVGLAEIAIAAVLIFVATSSRAPAAPGGGAATASAAKAVDIRGFAFHPGTLRIPRGAKVVFSNSSEIGHTATDKGAFDTGIIQPGHSAGVKFKRKGVFMYFCRIHHFMHGKIVVH
jgi:plastocyanin